MSSSYQRKQQMKHIHITCIAIGIFIVLGGLYFIFVIRGETNRKNEKYTESTTGTVTEVKAADSGYYSVTIDYNIDGSDLTANARMKNDPGVGTVVEIRYEPLHYSNIYLEGVSQTGKDDVIEGLIMILAGGAFIGIGILFKRSKDKKKMKEIQTEE